MSEKDRMQRRLLALKDGSLPNFNRSPNFDQNKDKTGKSKINLSGNQIQTQRKLESELVAFYHDGAELCLLISHMNQPIMACQSLYIGPLVF